MRHAVDLVAELENARFPTPALSLYMPVSTWLHEPRLELEAMVVAERQAAGVPEHVHSPGGLAAELDTVAARLRGLRFRCPAIAVFSHRYSGLFQLCRLPLPVRPALRFRRQLDLAALRRQLEQRPPALVVIAGKERAHILSVVLADVARLEDVAGVPISHHRRGARSVAGLQRREDEHAHANLVAVADRIERLVRAPFYRRLYVTGPPEARGALVRELGPRARVLLSGDGHASVHARGEELDAALRRVAGRNTASASRA